MMISKKVLGVSRKQQEGHHQLWDNKKKRKVKTLFWPKHPTLVARLKISDIQWVNQSDITF